MFNIKNVAQLYAKAIYKFAINNDQSLESWQKILKFITAIVSDKKINKLIYREYLSQKIASLFIDIFHDKINQNGKNLIKIFAENKRLTILNIIFEEFMNLCQIYKEIINVDIISAYKLNEKQIESINTMLQKRLLKKINTKYFIDKSIIDGLIIKFNDMVINASALFRLDKLSNILQY